MLIVEVDPVLLCNDLGTTYASNARHSLHPEKEIVDNFQNSLSVKEAVRIAQSNNFMGLICSARLLVSLHKLKYFLRRTNEESEWSSVIGEIYQDGRPSLGHG